MPYYTQIDGKKYDRALLQAFERSVQGRGDGRVSTDDVKTEIEKRVKDGKGLTDVEIATLRYAADHFKVTTAGQRELSDVVSKLSGQQVFDWQRTDNPLNVNLDSQRLPRSELHDKVAKFVVDHASDGASIDNGKLFPGVDSSNLGLFAYTLEDGAAETLLGFAKATLGRDAAKLDDYDPAKHVLLAVRVTFDEEAMYVGIVDRATGEASVVGQIAYVDDLEYSFADADEFESKTGLLLSDIDSGTDRDYWSEMSHEELAHALVRGGSLLDIGKTDDVFGRPSSADLERATWDLDSAWGDENIMDGAVEAKAGQLPHSLDRSQAAVDIMQAELRWDDMEWKASPAGGPARGVTDAVVKQAAKMVHEGFGYAPQNRASLDENTDRIEKLLAKLGKRSELRVVVAEGTGVPQHLAPADPLLTKTFLFFNDQTGDFAAITARDSTL